MDEGGHREQGGDVGQSSSGAVDPEAVSVTDAHDEHGQTTTERHQRTGEAEARGSLDQDDGRHGPARDRDRGHAPQSDLSRVRRVDESDDDRHDAHAGAREAG